MLNIATDNIINTNNEQNIIAKKKLNAEAYNIINNDQRFKKCSNKAKR